MSQNNDVIREYMQDNCRFSDLLNSLYTGRMNLQKEDLSDLEEEELEDFLAAGREYVSEQEIETMLNLCVMKKSRTAYYALFCIQAQTEYDMIDLNYLYMMMNYLMQIRRIEKIRKFSKEDKLVSVVVFTMLWSSDEWTAPRSRYERMGETDERLLKFIPDLELNLIVPKEIREFGNFKTELGLVLEFLAVEDHLDKVRKLLEERKEKFSHMDYDSAKVLQTCSKMVLDIPEDGERGAVNIYRLLEKKNSIIASP